ncbi:Inactive poly [ADP-ribose] polymerase RCD1 [Thalictrum thalictroides]|uniref:Inactive poly [ADP-ribose] polymerase RCD1 n=1 Tax=Thalictrum thalictroides TaxID=46969 RepID=A0A7J6XE40_THATH|nr:Inactive poly [ADP-ribose] polymerase RCD1 [Thalictrum thalictroides]
MEVESAKVLDNGRRIVLDMKRKRAARCMAYFTGAACTDAHCSVQDALPEMHCKQIDSHTNFNGCKNSFTSHLKKPLLKNYSNFMKSGLPQRVLFYENGEWTDFPEGLIGLVKDDFRMKKVAIKVDFRGSPSLLDFLRMILVDLKTGLQQPIAWIDEVGICFFPEADSVKDVAYDAFQSGGKENHPLLYEPIETQEIKLQLDIEIVTDGNLKMEECSEGSSSHVKRVKIDGKPVNTFNGGEHEAGTGVKPDVEVKEVIGESQTLGWFPPKNLTFESSYGRLTTDDVQCMLIKGMGSSISADNINAIQRCSGYWAHARLELFEKQVEITEKYHGNANVRYAWLGSSKEAASRILMHGLGFNELPKIKAMYAGGVHLTSASCSRISASYCDVDENGVQHMVLCRVILGNMELVPHGTEQFFPSSDKFDSGADDLLNPENYVIWNMNMNSHIYPEYVVSFKSASSDKGGASESQSKAGVSAVTDSNACGEKVHPDTSPGVSVGDCHETTKPVEISQRKSSEPGEVPEGKSTTINFAGRPPKSSWMPFSLLFKAIENKVPYSAMKSVYQSYGQFRNNKISRDELVQRVRLAVGDTLLRATIISIQTKLGNHGFIVPKAERGTY